jgi:uncharacterized membrane protein YdjX (TVP38/TMEM64 family)
MKISSKKTEKDIVAPHGDNIEAISPQWWRPVLLFSLLAVMMVTTNIFGFSDGILELQDWIQGQGFLGYVIFVLIHIVAMIVVLPRAILAVAAGVLFGAVEGIVLVTISSVAGVYLTFIIARYLARDAFRRLLFRSKKLSGLYYYTEKRGVIIVVIIRLLTFSPSNLLNYCFGLTNIRVSTYMFWSFLCMFPATIVYVLTADAATKGVSQVRIPWLSIGVTVTVLAIVFTVVYFLLVKLKRKVETVG